jgi:hypothetical protein
MAEIDFGGLLDALTEEKGLLPLLDATTSLEDATSALEAWRSAEGTGAKFDGANELKIGIRDGKITINDADVNDLKSRLSGSINTEIKPPDVASVLKDLGIKSTDSPEFQKFDAANKKAWAEQPNVKKAQGVNDSTNTGNQISNSVSDPSDPPGQKGQPKDAEDMQRRANRANKGGKLNDAIEKIKKGVEYGKKFGKFVVTAIAVGGAAFGALELYNAIKKHQNAMNGCWYINMQTNDKCKIKPLTCNESDTNDPNDQSGYSLCSMRESIKDTHDENFNPCAIGAKPKGTGDFPGIYNDTTLDTACANCADCVVSSDCKQSEADCSSKCDPSKFNIPTGYTLKCVSVDFWGAADDLIDGGLGGIDNIIGKILKIIIYIIIGIVGVILVVFIIKFLLGLIQRKK